MRRASGMLGCAVAGLFLLGGCGEAESASALPVGEGDLVKVDPGKEDSSSVAVFLDFEFDGEVLASSSWNPKRTIEDQLLYTIGQLNGEKSVGRLDKLELSDIETERLDDGKTRITYHATLLVAWGKSMGSTSNVPRSYTLKMPRDASFSGQEAFTEAYSKDCVDFGAHDVTAGSMWYYYRPRAYRCDLDSADIIELEAEVSISDVNTTGKYPEYDKIWEDGQLNVVAVFGKYKDGATSSSDAGIAAYNNFSTLIQDVLAQHDLVTAPEEIPMSPGVDTPEIVYTATMDAEHAITITTILVDNVRTAGADFDQRYEALSRDADLIIYNGHAGLGANIRALASKGDWQEGQYTVVFMNGCDTYAYVDSALFDAHAAVNPDDDTGTKYTDIVTNAMPSFFRSMPRATIGLVSGLMSFDDPRTYEQMFNDVDPSQIILVSGEQDNTFVPGGADTGDAAWAGLEEAGGLSSDEEARFETPALPEGTYRFEITGTGDADLYVRVGNAPSTSSYDCRPFRASSRERCEITLSAPAPVHVMVRGWARSSDYELKAERAVE